MKKYRLLSFLIALALTAASLLGNWGALAAVKKQPTKVADVKPAPVFTVTSVSSGAENQETRGQIITPDNGGFYYTGRIDTTDPKAPGLIWEGTEIRARFTGKRVGFRFSDSWGQNFFNCVVDGKIRVLQLKEWGTYDYLLNEALPEGMHELILFKRTEAMYSGTKFGGLILDKDATFGPKPEPLPLRIEFYGDSITAGACDEDPGKDQYDDFSTHNNYLAYGAVTARNLNAEYSCIAFSGIGICYSWNSLLMPEVYDKLYADLTSEKYQFPNRKPDIVVINLGQNDFGYPNSRGLSFPADFTEKYVQFVRKIRTLYSQTKIICAMGGMSAYRDSPELQAAFQKAVKELQTADSKIYSFIFSAFTYNHPRVDTHAKLAEELTTFIKKEILDK